MANFIFISPHFPDSYWKFCASLKNLGFNVLGIGDAPYNEISDECKFSLTEYYCCTDMENFENERRAVKYFQEKYGKIDFLESNNEYWLMRDAMLREEFGIDSGVYPKECIKYRSKIAQKKIFEKNDILCARYTEDSTEEGLLKFVKKVGYPIFVKPDDGVGAQGTFKIKNSEDLHVFLNKKDPNKKYITEEFVDGTIVSFDGIADSKSNVVFCTQNVFLEDNASIVTEKLDDLYYCDPFLTKTFEKLGRNVVKAMEIKKRFFHIEFFVLNSDHKYLGKKGTRIPLEVNCRPAGAYTPDLIDFANSVSCYDIYADVISYDENRQDLNKQKYYAAAASRRNNATYVHSDDECMQKYNNQICMYGDYPVALSDDMGDRYAFAKFDTLKEVQEFDKFVRMRAK